MIFSCSNIYRRAFNVTLLLILAIANPLKAEDFSLERIYYDSNDKRDELAANSGAEANKNGRPVADTANGPALSEKSSLFPYSTHPKTYTELRIPVLEVVSIRADDTEAKGMLNKSMQYAMLEALKLSFTGKQYRRTLEQVEYFLRTYPKSPYTSEAIQYWVSCRVKLLDEHTKAAEKSGNAAGATIRIINEAAVEPNARTTVSSSYKFLADDKFRIPLTIQFKDYVASALKSNASHLTDRAEFNRIYTNSIANLQGYNFKVSIDQGVTSNYDNNFNYGVDIKANVSKLIYDGGKKQVLEKELEMIKALSKIGNMNSANNVILIAVNNYCGLYSVQQEYALMEMNYQKYNIFMRSVDALYQKVGNLSPYDYYSSKSLQLVMERELSQKKADTLKAETAFRQFGKIYSSSQIRLMPLTMATPGDMESIETAAITNNSSIEMARLNRDLQMQKIEEKKAENGVSVQFISSLGSQIGSSGYSANSSSSSTGSRPTASVGVTVSIPVFDGGVSKSLVLSEEIEALKQKLILEKTTEDVIKQINDIYLDFKVMNTTLEITAQLAALNKKRLQIAVERFNKGLEGYRSVREAWSDSISSEIESVRQSTLQQKFIVDMSILSGKKMFDL